MNAVSLLRELEAKYQSALVSVRALIEMEGGAKTDSEVQRPVVTTPVRQASPLPTTVRSRNPGQSQMTKGDAAEMVLKKEGSPMAKDKIFEAVKAMGHPVTNAKALMVAMSSDQKRFQSLGGGFWTLRVTQPQETQKAPLPDPFSPLPAQPKAPGLY